jgi:DNA repair exonuclease SbcCD ATPase subunit
MNSKIQEFRTKLERRKGKQEQIENNIEQALIQIQEDKRDLRRHERAKEVIRQVGLKTQQQLSYNVSEITSMALNTVLDDPYELTLEFVERRNKTECDIFFVRDDIKIEPFGGGGGAVDIASFALRVASWSMERPNSRNTLILDEPFKHLKGEMTNRKMLEMVQQISKKLNIQIIMVSDERVSREATVQATDKLFETRIKRGVTKVIES